MDKQYILSFGGGLPTKVYDKLSWSSDSWVAVRNEEDELWTYYPVWRIHEIREIERVVPEFVREPGVSLAERRIR